MAVWSYGFLGELGSVVCWVQCGWWSISLQMDVWTDVWKDVVIVAGKYRPFLDSDRSKYCYK